MPNNARSTRDGRLDALRGLLLMIMTIDHLPSSISGFTYQALGYVTAAEGFVFLSGLVAGRVYQKYCDQAGTSSLWPRAVKRAAVIYAYHLFTFLILFSFAVLLGFTTFYTDAWLSLCRDRPALAVLMGSTLLYQPQLMDILPMYSLFIFTVPLMVRSSRRGRNLILLTSFLLWGWAQFGVMEALERAISKHLPVNFGTFDVLAWQFIFICGVWLGVRSISERGAKSKKWELTGCALIAGFFFLARHHLLIGGSFVAHMEVQATSGTMGPVRLINFLVIARLFSGTVRAVDNFWYHGLCLLGRHSLQVFTYHVFLVYLLYGFILHSFLSELWVTVSVFSLFIPAWLSENRARGISAAQVAG
jgi:hypothetical protein